MANALGGLAFTVTADIVNLAKLIAGVALGLGGIWTTVTNVNPPGPAIALGIGEMAIGAYLLDPQDFSRVLGTTAKLGKK